MKTLVLYHNTECSKCRAVNQILKESGLQFKSVEYLINPPTPEVLDQLLKQLKMEPVQLVRKGEDIFEELKLDTSPPQTRNEWIKLMVEHPILIERPIVSDGESAVVGRPPEKVIEWLKARNLT